MSGGWSKQHDFAKLADARAELEYSIPLDALQTQARELGRDLGEGVSAAEEPLRVQLRFARERGVAVADVSVRGAIRLQCQRCLQPYTLPLALDSRVALLRAEADADSVSPDLETVLAPEGRVSASALVGEEVLLALPIAPRHESVAECGAEGAVLTSGEAVVAGAVSENETEEGARRRPFADLRALMDKPQGR
jgi:uncharacterized protein